MLAMIDSQFVVGGYAISPHGFYRIVKRTEAFITVEPVSSLTMRTGDGRLAYLPGAPEGYDHQRTKVLSDDLGEYLQWGRARHCWKWRPWAGQAVPHRVLNPEGWPYP